MAKKTSMLWRIVRTAVITLVIVLLPPALMLGWMQTRGDWHLSASNVGNDVLVEVYWGHSTDPRYTALLTDHSIPTDVTRVTRIDLPTEIGTTTFFDVTLRPGRWIVVIDGIRLDIMEAGLTVDNQIELRPNE